MNSLCVKVKLQNGQFNVKMVKELHKFFKFKGQFHL